MMRTGLLNHEIYPEFADHITTFLANCLIRTSDLVMDHKEKKELVREFINPDLCGITEDLVYMVMMMIMKDLHSMTLQFLNVYLV